MSDVSIFKKKQKCVGIPSNPGCGKDKLLQFFYENPKGSGIFRKTCKECISNQRKIEKEKIEELRQTIKNNSTEENKSNKKIDNEILIEKLRLLEEIAEKLNKEIENYELNRIRSNTPDQEIH